MTDLVIRNAEIGGAHVCDVRVRDGVVAEISQRLATPGAAIDARGGALIPGLNDHHIHLLATAAAAQSIDVSPAATPHARAFRAKLIAADQSTPRGAWLRAVNYHESVAGPLNAATLDGVMPSRPVRVQYGTGSLWVLNTPALRIALGSEATPPCVEVDDAGRPTGRVWRGDAWLRGRIPKTPPDLAMLSERLARSGVTGFCDASVTNDEESAAFIAAAVRAGALRQNVMLMSGGKLQPNPAYRVGPVKILLDDADLPPLEDLVERIRFAHARGRNAAVHCVTRAELALCLAAFECAGVCAGDRIEHGGVVCPDSAGELARLGLVVVTQPGFIAERGDRYLHEAPLEDHAHLYPCAGLLRAGVKVAASTDAPYTKPDLWAAMRTAVSRLSRRGRCIGPDERVSPRRALVMFLGALESPGDGSGKIRVGAPADLCLLDRPLNDALEALDEACVAGTFVRGRCIYARKDVPAEGAMAL